MIWNWLKLVFLYPLIIIYETIIGKWPFSKPK
jgi:hypothetical protein